MTNINNCNKYYWGINTIQKEIQLFNIFRFYFSRDLLFSVAYFLNYPTFV